MNFLHSPIGRLRAIAFIEGVSFIALVGIAMPLKYMADSPGAVKVVGMAHGVLFLIFLLSLLEVWIKHKWSFMKTFMAFLSSLLPFGTFVLDVKVLKKDFEQTNL